MKTKKRIKKMFYVIVFLTVSIMLLNAQEIPKMISYQGKLLDNGVPVTGSKNLRFAILDSNDEELWYENHYSENVTNGLYSVNLGSTTPIPEIVFEDSSRWLEVRIDGGAPLLPRTRLLSVPYSYIAEKSYNSYNSDKLEGEEAGYYLEWSNLSNIPADIANGDNIGINSIDGIENETGNIDLIGEGITITPDLINSTITFTSVGGSSIPAEDFTEGEVTNLRLAKLSDGSTPWTNDSVGINSINNVSNEAGNVNLIAGDNIVITPNDANNTIEISASGGTSHNAGFATLLYNSGSYTGNIITTNLGRIPKIIEISMNAGSGDISQSKWVDEDQNGFGVLTCLYVYDYSMTSSLLIDSVRKICRIQTGASAGIDFRVGAGDNNITINIDETFGIPTYPNTIQLTWYVE